MDPNRSSFSSHCFCLWENESKEKVIDICFAKIAHDEDHQGEDECDNIFRVKEGENIVLQGGYSNLLEYLSMRGVGPNTANLAPMPLEGESFPLTIIITQAQQI